MTDHLNLRPHRVEREDRPDGTILLRSGYDLDAVVNSTGDWLHHWAETAPDRVFLAEREGEGWREITYAQALADVRNIAGHLVSRDLGPDRPIMVISGNSVDHGLLMLAAMYVGVPIVPVAEQYSLIPAAHGRLAYAAGLVNPGMVYAGDAITYAGALALDIWQGVEVLSSAPGDSGATGFGDLLRPSGANVEDACARVGPDTLAKILLTSGSTSDPKGVLTTQRMLTTNQVQIAGGLPFLKDKPPVLVDWLPWNHVFGGSHNFNLVLANGGSFYIDDGKPLPALFGRTVENLRLVPASISFNVPVGFAQLVQALKADDGLRRTYFERLDMIFYAGASLPQTTWDALEELALATTGTLPLITSSWGLTETAPGALLQHQPAKGAGMIGVPLPGIDVKLIPDADMRCEIRVRGDSITPGYLNAPEKTAAAFDDERFFCTGDAVRFVDDADPSKGMLFDGRISEDFKLTSGTWVRAANLRLELLAALAPLAQDVVLCGEGRESIGALILPNRAAIEAQGWPVQEDAEALISPPLAAALQERFALHGIDKGSAARVASALVMSQPPDIGEGEATAKGNLNFARVLERRADLVSRLFAQDDPAQIKISH